MTNGELQFHIPEAWGYKFGKYIYLPGYLPPSLNKMLRRAWIRWERKAHVEDLGYKLLAAGANMIQRDDGKKRGLLIVTERSRFLDEDNLRAGAKPLIDILRRDPFRLIHNDTPEWLDQEVKQVHVGKGFEGTNIVILASEPLEGEDG